MELLKFVFVGFIILNEDIGIGDIYCCYVLELVYLVVIGFSVWRMILVLSGERLSFWDVI